MKEYIQAELTAHRDTVDRVLETMLESIERAARMLASTLLSGHKAVLFGNGGSAADAQHIAAELVGRYQKHRRGLPAVALTTDTSALTAIANDFGYEHVFARQVEALCSAGDIAFGISTSGKSPNVLQALRRARELHCTTVGLCGEDGTAMDSLCDVVLAVPASVTSRVQEMHIAIGHILCGVVELEHP